MRRGAAAVTGAAGMYFPGISRGALGPDGLKVALVGSGGRGTGAVSQFLTASPESRLVAIADAFGEKPQLALKNLESRFASQLDCPASRQFVGLDAYKHAINEADLVLLTTPGAFRPAHFEAAVARGCHVFMEKPLGVDAPGIRRILAASQTAKAKRLTCVAGFNRRFQASYRDAYKRVQEGDIGQIVSMEAMWRSSGIWQKERLPGQTELQFQIMNWANFVWLSGEMCLDMHVANLDVCNWFMGALPLSAKGTGLREDPLKVGEKFGDCLDHFEIEYKYPGGVKLASSTYLIKGRPAAVNEVFIGTKGRAEALQYKPVITDNNGSPVWRRREVKDEVNPYQQEHNELYASIIKGKGLNNVEDSATSTLTAILGRTAAYTGREVTWDEVMNSKEEFCPPELTWDSDPPTKPGKYGDYPMPARARLGA